MSDSLHTGYRWSNITPEDHSGILYIVTFLGFIYTSFAFFTRVVIKWRILGLDDGAMLIAQVILPLASSRWVSFSLDLPD